MRRTNVVDEVDSIVQGATECLFVVPFIALKGAIK